MLECKIEDKEILEKFCEFLDIRKDRITIGHNGRSVALTMTDNVFSTSPSKYGINRNKSHIENHIPQFVYPFISLWALGCFPLLAIVNKAAINICVQVFVG